jgi:tRNA U54 and U55 pseudouridine synthase Pus10
MDEDQESQNCGSVESGERESDIPANVNIKRRDACRLIRALRKVAYELRRPREGKAKRPEKKAYRAFIAIEDQVGVHHLQHRVGKKEELQTTLQHPHQFRNTLIRVYRLKNLRWSPL